MATVLETTTCPLGPTDAGVPMTLDEFEKAEYEEGYRYELIHGVLVVTPPPAEGERDASDVLSHWLRNYQDDHEEGSALDLTLPEQNIRTGDHNRRADRVIWTGLGRTPRTRGRHDRRDVPSIVVEFPSVRPADQRRDYDEKKIEYRDAGVKEYWIFDRFRRAMTVYYWRGKRWTKKTIAADGVYCTPLLPGFELSIAKLLAVSDKYLD